MGPVAQTVHSAQHLYLTTRALHYALALSVPTLLLFVRLSVSVCTCARLANLVSLLFVLCLCASVLLIRAPQVVSLAGRCAERLVMGEGEMTAMGSPDLFHANMIAREMVLTMGMGRRMGPVDLMYVIERQDNSGLMLRSNDPAQAEERMYFNATDMSTEQVRGLRTHT